jgi:hypothetical protein
MQENLTTENRPHTPAGYIAPDGCLIHPTVQDPSARVLRHPWPSEMAVIAASNGWHPVGSDQFCNQCPTCGGYHILTADPARFCPWCGSAVDHQQAYRTED